MKDILIRFRLRREFAAALLSFLVLILSINTGLAQCTIVANATAVDNYTMVQTGGTNGVSVAYSPQYNVFYAAIGGSSGFPLETFNATGTSLLQSTTGIDFRGLWWNSNDQQLEANGSGTIGLWRNDLDANGYALSSGNNPFGGQNQPNAASCGAYDCSTDNIIYYYNGSIYFYNRETVALVDTVVLTGVPVSPANINSTSVGFTGCTGQEIALLDYVDQTILFFNKTTGAYIGKSQLPVGAATNSQYNFAYAGNLAWLFNTTTRVWTGYQVLTGPPIPMVNLGNDTTLCPRQTLTLNAGNPGDIYLWQDSSTNQTYTVTQAGTYYVAVSNGSCYIARDTIVVNQANISLGNDTTLCNGGSVLLSENVPGATYLWQNGSTLDTLRATTTGQYAVTVTTGMCVAADTINVNFVAPPTVNLGNDTVICGGTSLLLHATRPGAKYLWQDGSTNSTFNVTATGQYAVTVSIGSCSASDTINVATIPPPVVNLGNDTAVCPGSPVALNATNPGAIYMWTDSSTKAMDTALSAGTYKVTVTVSGCAPVTDSIKITNLPHPTVNLGNDTSLCGGGSLTLNATNAGAGYHWQDGSSSPTYTVTTTGQYSVTVTAGCTATGTIKVTFAPAPVIKLGNDTTLCTGQSLVLNAANTGASYLWQDGSTADTFNVVTIGEYAVTASVGSCSASDSVHVSFKTKPTANLGNDTTICGGGSLVLNATTAGATFQWQDGSTNPTLTATTSGAYSVTVTLGCPASDTINVTFTNGLKVNLGNDTTICPGNTLLLNATIAGATYKWQDGTTNPTFNVVTPGEYTVTVTAGTCPPAADSVKVSNFTPPTVNLGNDTTLCQGQPLVLNAQNAGSTYQWQDGSTNQTFNATVTGNYAVTVTDANKCTGSDNLNATFMPKPVVNLGADTALCNGQTISYNVTTAGGTYQWQDASTNPTYSVTTAGAYSVTVTANSCSASDTANVTFNPPPTVNLGNDTTLCPGQTLVLNATNANATYKWQDASTDSNYIVAKAGTYSVTVTVGSCPPANGAVTVTYANLTQPQLGNDTTLCPSQTLALDATTAGALSYQWQDGTSTAAYTVSQAGTYSVTVTEGTCTTSASVVVSYNSVPKVSLGRDTAICSFDSLQLNAQNPGDTYLWKDKSTKQTLEAKLPGAYWVTVSNECGAASDTIKLTAKDCSCVMQVPNAFTPNGDGKNDVFMSYFNCTIVSYSIQIYDRWGELVFETTDFGTGWDGNSRGGTKEPLGVYTWIMNYNYLDRNQQANYGHMSGDVTLFR